MLYQRVDKIMLGNNVQGFCIGGMNVVDVVAVVAGWLAKSVVLMVCKERRGHLDGWGRSNFGQVNELSP